MRGRGKMEKVAMADGRSPFSMGFGLGLGALAMYMLDPRAGRRRRVRARDQLTRAVHDLQEGVTAAARDVRNRTRGVTARAAHRLSHEIPDDRTLAERVRAHLGHVSNHPGAIVVTADSGHVRLRGHILREEHLAVLDEVAKTAGVTTVHDELQVHESAEHVPDLQGGGTRTADRRRWRPATRLFVGLGSLMLGWKGARSRSRLSSFVTGVAAVGLTRSLTNLTVGEIIGTAPHPHGIEVQKTIHIEAPIEEVFALFDRFENFPRFMSHVRQVDHLGDSDYRWKVTGPADSTFEFTTRIIEREANRVIAWESLPGSAIENTGWVRFDAYGEGRTRVTVHLVYEPPVGVAGHAIAKLLGADPKHQMDRDFVRLKSLLEQGKATGREGQVSLEDLTTH